MSLKLCQPYVSITEVGVGISMEGIEQSPVVYDLMSEMAFQHDKVDVKVMHFTSFH